MTAPIPPFPVAALAGIWLAGQRGGGDERTEHGMSAQAVLSQHRLTGVTKFSHHGGSSYLEWPKCGCGAQMHPNLHPQHLLDVLAAAGFTVTKGADHA